MSFGIVIDPGGGYIENLYRCGFSLADIDMIIVTHDHADHLSSSTGDASR
jgi:glyoxylase-like metal-dependent hydrolase (beta-lactamase superfamily II)